MTRQAKHDKPRILVADDDSFIRDLVRSFYTTYNFELIEAANGKQALEAARAYAPHLILLDIQMPVLNGYETAGMLKKDEALKRIPVIIITGQEQCMIDEQIDGLYDHYLRKPFKKLELMEATLQFLAGTAQ